MGDSDYEVEKGNMRYFRHIIFYNSVQEGFILKRIKNEGRRITCGCRIEGCPWRMRTFGQMLSLVLFCLQSRERVLGGNTSTTPSITGPPQKSRRLEAGSTSTQPSNIRLPPTRRMNLGSTSAAIGVPINNQNMPTTTHYPSTQNQSSSEAAYGSSSHTNQSNDAFSQPFIGTVCIQHITV
ncbi:hypothetical protein ACOSP7_024195 [Xanthoceras sorbifolium]